MNHVVYYLLAGHYRATRHAEGCGTLRRAEAFDGAANVNISDHHVVTAEVYARLPDNYPAPKDHSCLL